MAKGTTADSGGRGITRPESELHVPIIDAAGWKKWEDNNTDPYGKCCVDIARKVMTILDERPGDFDCNALISEGEKACGEDGITGFMAGAIAAMVSKCHSRGDEFRRKWNLDTGDEGRKANTAGTVLNPALLCVRSKE